jgi:prostaglandin-endoperoxide synthase 2
MRDRTRDGFYNRAEAYGLSHCPRFWRAMMAIPPLNRVCNKQIISGAAKRAPSRPYAFSTLADYTSWESLTDRTYFSRHLPPKDLPKPPARESKTALFKVRQGGPTLSEDSTVLFMSFAQWFADGFLLTNADDRRRTFTNHKINLSPVYGLRRSETDALRVNSNARGEKGRMKTETVNGEDYAPRLFDKTKLNLKDLADPDFDERKAFKCEFASLQRKLIGFNRNRLRLISAAAKAKPTSQHPAELAKAALRVAELAKTTFAFGGERANITPFTAALSTLFLREHNRLAAMLENANPGWDDERVFQTARNINIVLLIKIVVEEYVNHISPYHFQLYADPSVSWRAIWNRPNWIPVEFNLLYRWHSMTPDKFRIGGQDVPVKDSLQNNSYLTERGLAETLSSASKQQSRQLGLLNTADGLLLVELDGIRQSRLNHIGSYNDYREAFKYPRVTRFEQITDDQEKIDVLRRFYGDVNNIEFLVGLFAEDIPPRAAVPPLMGRMVAFDAFTHALTNPLLSEQVFNERTFSKEGMETIQNTHTLQDVLNRNLAPGQRPAEISMTAAAA